MIRLEGISKGFGGTVLFDRLDFIPAHRGATCLLGPSGCGKTTLLGIVAGLIVPDDGSVTGVGRVSCVFQEDRLLPWETVRENAMYAMDPSRPFGERRDAADELLEILEIADAAGKYPSEISGGMARRAALARALAAPFDTILLDEPLSSLDPDLRRRIVERLRPRLEGKTSILVTHDYETAADMSDEVYRMSVPPVRMEIVGMDGLKGVLDQIERIDSESPGR